MIQGLRYLLFCTLLLLFAPSAAQKGEVRAVWLTTLSGLDWPQTKVHTPADTLRQQRELLRLLDRLSLAGINTIFFQTRIRATVAYPSAIEPWDEAFTGTTGRSPGYDPLAFAIQECHKRNMELHAWIVAVPAGSREQVRRQASLALHRRKPDLALRTSEGYILNPGEQEAAAYLAELCAEIVSNYCVDGIHLDYIRYPEKEISFDDHSTYRRYHSEGQTLQAWHEENITRMLSLVSNRVRTLRPWVKMSCSVVGKRTDLPRYSARGWSAQGPVAQNVKLWMEQGLVDWIVPMLYFDGRDFYPFIQDWVEAAQGTQTQIVAGLATYRLSTSAWPLSTLRRQIEVSRLMGTAGQAFFRARFVADNVKGNLDLLRTLLYSSPARTPLPLRIDTLPPSPPLNPSLTDGLRWSPSTSPDVSYRVYYSWDYDAEIYSLLTTTTDTICLLPPVHSTFPFYYRITAVDKYGRESEPVPVNHPTEPRPLPLTRRP